MDILVLAHHTVLSKILKQIPGHESASLNLDQHYDRKMRKMSTNCNNQQNLPKSANGYGAEVA
jgi:hypothetical protein